MSNWEKDTVRTQDAAPRASQQGVWQLAVLTEKGALVVPLDRAGFVTVGRAQDATIPLDDPGVSRLHLGINIGSVVEARDLGSSNGTRYRGRTLAQDESVALAPGDTLELGGTILVLQRRGTAPATATRDTTRTVARLMPGVVLEDPSMKRLASMIERVASGMISVLLLGETGVGKEIFAEMVHQLSPRADAPFLRLNCAALTENLLESELFGYEKGAFTGAATAKRGLLETANGGTVFIDEVGELPMPVQVKLLRVLEERKVRRVGGLESRDIDVRVVAATHRDMPTEVERGRFREDLYFRLNGITLEIPPLRARAAELDSLARHFLAEGSRRAGRAVPPPLTPSALEVLRRHDWPGNLRELRNVMERAVLLAGDEPIGPEHIQGLDARRRAATQPDAPSPVAQPAPRSVPPPAQPAAPTTPTAPPPAAAPAAASAAQLREEMAALEKQRILDTLEKCGGNQTLAAKILGIPRRTFINRLTEYGIARPRKNSALDGDE